MRTGKRQTSRRFKRCRCIAVIQPEDYIIEDELKGATSYNSTANTRTKNYTAIKRNDWLCSGLGHYFGLDAVWIRIALILLVLLDLELEF
jgi:hypothetical protein